ncbi:MAG TPA: cytochrome c biogenesis protein CcdA, partial [Candidatus Binataceae bacterium]|nr:cytochrome c biogenesis protein CcdA [Candidatus Binataceae bacterium]
MRFLLLFLFAVLFTLAPKALALKAPEVVHFGKIGIDKALAAGTESNLIVDATIDSGWHINSNHPANADYIATKLELSLPSGVSAGEVQYPPAEKTHLAFSSEELSVFTGAIQFRVPIKTDAPNLPTDAVTITLDYQACNNNQCLAPTSISKVVQLSTIDGPSAESTTAEKSAPQQSDWLAQTFAGRGYVVGFLIVLLGGLALNLTPCVYPLIGVTIAYFGNQGGGPRRVLILAILFVLGIAIMFSSVGVAVALSGGLFGAAMQNPYVLSAVAAMMLVLAASSFGLFVIQPPQFMAQWAGAARPGYAGSFLMGLGMGVIAAPCIGPIVLGLLLMVERSGSALFGFALFFTLAVGLGLPYIGLAMAAGSIRKLPRSGEWLAWVEQLFGFILVGLAIYFLDPVLPNHVMSRILPYYAAATGIFLGFFSPAGRNWRPFLILRSVLGIAAVAALIIMMLPHAKPLPVQFQPFDVAALDAAVAEHKPVLVDFRADWCIPCREMDHSTFEDPAVVKAAQRFVRMKADLTSQDAKNAALMAQFKIQGV